jgi:hypothetical protein
MITDMSIQKIAENCDNLRSLTLNQCVNITDISIKIIAEKCPYLEVLSIMDCHKVKKYAL